MRSRYTFLGIAIISFAVVLLSAFILLFSQDTSEFTNNYPLLSKYISDYSNELKSDYQELAVQDETSINPEKQGEIKLDERRKVVKFQTDLTESQKIEIEEEYGIKFTNDKPTSGIYSVLITDQSNVEGLTKDKSVNSIETDVPVAISADTVDWGVTRIGADKIWESSNGVGVTVAVIDTGIQLDHTDLSQNIVSGYDFVNNRDIANDDNGHGTHVAGIIAALSNQVGIVGSSYSSRLMPIKVLNSTGSGYVSDVAKGVYWATDNGAQIINISLGTTTDTDVLRNAINYAASKGVLLVGAAGNSSGAPCNYPAAYGAVICVVATDSSNKLASFSNIGGELAAPGVSNYSTYLNNTYRYLSGTSMASPHVAGSLAIVRSFCSTCTSDELRNVLRETAVDLGEQGQDIIFGYGLVDLVAAVEKLKPEENVEENTPDQSIQDPLEGDSEIKDPVSTQPPKKGFDKQRTTIIEPKKDNKGRTSISMEESISIKFSLDPITENSGLERTVVYLNNEPIYTTTKQEDEYTIEGTLLSGVQQFIRVSSFFKDGSSSHDQIIIDRNVVYKGNPFNNVIKKGRSVLGISTGFSLRKFFNF
jgi:subtilisin family serine protease